MRKHGVGRNVLLAAAAGLAISSAAQAQFIISPGSGAFTDISTTGTLVITGDDSSGPVAVSAAVANVLGDGRQHFEQALFADWARSVGHGYGVFTSVDDAGVLLRIHGFVR